MKLQAGDLLVFYAGLQRWAPAGGFRPATEHLGIIGFFEVAEATLASNLTDAELHDRFSANAHVRSKTVLRDQRDRLILVRGAPGSCLLERSIRISDIGRDRAGAPLKILSAEMQQVFGDFGGRVAIQRSMPRTVDKTHVHTAAEFVRSLRRAYR